MSGPPDIRSSSVSTAGYEDGLGRRSVRFNREVGGMLECLHLRPQFLAFEPVLRAAAIDLARLDDERFARVREFEKDAGALTVVSELVTGHRLIDVLETRHADEAGVSGIDAAFGFLLQAMPALAELHATSITHGAVAPGRIIVTPNSQVVLLDCIYGAAVERLNLSRRTLWRSFGIMASPMAGAAPIDRHTDVAQVALCALLLAAGRPLDGAADIAVLPAFVREVAELAEIRAGGAFAEGVARFFNSTLPAQSRRPAVAAEHAAGEIQRLVGFISEDESLNALAELVCFQPAARPRTAAEAETAAVTTEPRGVEQIQVPVSLRPSAPTPARPLETISAPEWAPAPAAPPVPAVAAMPVVPVPTPAPLIAPPVFAPAAAAPLEQLEQVVRIAAAPVPVPAPVAAAAAPPVAPPPVFVPVPVPMPYVAAAAPTVMPGSAPVAPLPPPVQFAPAAAPVLTPPVPAVVRIRQEGPPGYAPPPRQRQPEAPAALATARALPFVGRGASGGRSPVPWRLVAAAALVISVGLFAGRDYLQGGTAPVNAAPVASSASAAPAPVAAAAAVVTGSLAIDSQPSGAKITLDGAEVGVTPLTLDAVATGKHVVAITAGTASVQRTVRIEAGKQATISVPVFSGWVAVFAPIRLDVSTARRSLGSTDSGRILLPPGRHVLTLSNAEFGYTASQVVDIRPGEEHVLNLRPMGTVNLNASPWAEVWVDGARAGETPLANLAVPLGTREFVFKHPQYGERRLTATITTSGAALSVDFGKPPSRP